MKTPAQRTPILSPLADCPRPPSAPPSRPQRQQMVAANGPSTCPSAETRGPRPLDNLVFQGSNRQRSLAPVGLGYVYGPGRYRAMRSPMDPGMQVHKLALEVCLLVPPRQSIHTGCGILFELVERRLK